MEKKIKLAIACVFSLVFTFGFSQEKEQKKADELYKKYAYVDAIKVYERIAEKGYVNQDILQNLGNAYYFNADYKSALKWYDQLFQLAKTDNKVKLSSEYYYRYAQTLKSQERYDEANTIMSEFVKMAKTTDQRAKLFERNKDYLKEIKDNSGRFTLTPVSINTPYSEYATAFYGDNEVVFTASRKPGFLTRSAEWTGDSYYDLYKTTRQKENLSGEHKFSSVLNTTLNESTPVFTKDLKTIYFTRNNYTDGKKKTDNENTILLKLYKSTQKDNGEWTEAVELPFNSNQYSTAHPALSPDGKYLYFASDMNGTKGKSDIFRVTINPNGTYGKPENLGERINTEGRETFPFVSDDNVLYFSSDGLPGLGGLDIFGVKINEDGSLGRVQNIGRPGNSPDDDFAFVVNAQTRQGFLTSNRKGGKGKDDIYGFIENPALVFDCQKVIKGIVRDIDTKEVLTEVKVTLSDQQQSEIASLTNDTKGEFDFGKRIVDCNDDYVYVRAQKTDYAPAEEKVNIVEQGDEVYAEIFLKTTRKPLTVGDDLAKFFDIEIIYFDFDKSNIRPDAAIDLAKVVEVMKEHPTMKIAIKSHTDSRGSDSYNMSLSDRRAKSTREWMIKNGISPNRLTAKGYGESQLVNGCSNGVPCTEEEHQLNRRSEFIITEM
ncbi:OmpA family protein [Capnocytophaga catalasegens]|uniref:Cell envelope biogenesis protein OmpA n=1 Tax=Capnocytophaga catalasegens TaxID=1004260 RepID=A0AAV5AVM0_9FLAO|nr:OmpA family protein [Capnocytophaga catalasegens]GIZ15025.1 cell envelope biogenesis protein OmpA [Capnocytophaga catalasegens]GJM49405.1 cell envelope biogenesis protein OmpA [Capnocytophaga catalasegens]GJM52555.1 cell envelope biogenesis protein OmpA [Capnocytophaga catalasegens]